LEAAEADPATTGAVVTYRPPAWKKSTRGEWVDYMAPPLRQGLASLAAMVSHRWRVA
jgi:hypothetical protein